MFDNVTRLVSGCSCGRKHSLLTKECVVSADAEKAMKEYLEENGFRRPAIICDENTVKFTPRLLSQFGAPVKTVAGNAHATEIFTAIVGEFIDEEKPDVLIACGSGSVHDITRYCACEKKIPFLSYPTAASVDGFVSGVAAMTWYGQKLTFESVPPLAAFANPEVFCTAPERLTASGVGDVIGKYTSVFDWEIAHILTGEYICRDLCRLELDAIGELLDALENRAVIGEEAYTTKVMNALLLSGLAIQLAGNSRPASGAEHHMSHLWEMHRINETNDGLHGEQVGVGLLAVVKKYKAYLAAHDGAVDFDALEKIDAAHAMDREALAPVFRDLTDGILKENLPDGQLASSSLTKIRISDRQAQAEAIRKAAAELPEAEEIERILRLAGAPCTTGEIGLDSSEEFVEKSLRYAPYVRNRLTLLKIIDACAY